MAGAGAREFGSVFIDGKDVAKMVVSNGWAKVCLMSFFVDEFWLLLNFIQISFGISLDDFYDQVKELKGDGSPEYQELLQLEEQAKEQGLGKWSKVDNKLCFVMLWY